MKAKKGFTLVEIMIVVAIIAILAAIAIPNFISYRRSSQMNACKANMRAIISACEAYSMKSGNKAEDATSFANLMSDKNGAFLKSEPQCNGNSYTISYSDGKYSVTCGNKDTGDDYKHEL